MVPFKGPKYLSVSRYTIRMMLLGSYVVSGSLDL